MHEWKFVPSKSSTFLLSKCSNHVNIDSQILSLLLSRIQKRFHQLLNLIVWYTVEPQWRHPWNLPCIIGYRGWFENVVEGVRHWEILTIYFIDEALTPYKLYKVRLPLRMKSSDKSIFEKHPTDQIQSKCWLSFIETLKYRKVRTFCTTTYDLEFLF